MILFMVLVGEEFKIKDVCSAAWLYISRTFVQLIIRVLYAHNENCKREKVHDQNKSQIFVIKICYIFFIKDIRKRNTLRKYFFCIFEGEGKRERNGKKQMGDEKWMCSALSLWPTFPTCEYTNMWNISQSHNFKFLSLQSKKKDFSSFCIPMLFVDICAYISEMKMKTIWRMAPTAYSNIERDGICQINFKEGYRLVIIQCKFLFIYFLFFV
jgi:hypothetical protein